MATDTEKQRQIKQKKLKALKYNAKVEAQNKVADQK